MSAVEARHDTLPAPHEARQAEAEEGAAVIVQAHPLQVGRVHRPNQSLVFEEKV